MLIELNLELVLRNNFTTEPLMSNNVSHRRSCSSVFGNQHVDKLLELGADILFLMQIPEPVRVVHNLSVFSVNSWVCKVEGVVHQSYDEHHHTEGEDVCVCSLVVLFLHNLRSHVAFSAKFSPVKAVRFLS